MSGFITSFFSLYQSDAKDTNAFRTRQSLLSKKQKQLKIRDDVNSSTNGSQQLDTMSTKRAAKGFGNNILGLESGFCRRTAFTAGLILITVQISSYG